MNPFLNIYGIGPKLASELFAIHNPKQDIYDFLKKHKKLLPEITKKYIKYKPAHNIPRHIVQSIEPIITELGGVICGSYRREKPFVNDIDILFRENKYEELKKRLNLISEPLAFGSEIIRTLVKIKTIYIQLDIFILPPESNFFTYQLYLTGSREFNIIIRNQAKKKGCKLNQNNLICDSVFEIESEKDIFDILGMEYLEPKKRK